MISENLNIQVEDKDFIHTFYPAKKTKAPLVLVFPAWAGKDAFSVEKASMLASLGYNSCAIDLYGNGVIGKSSEENSQLMGPLINDRKLLQNRILAFFKEFQSLPNINKQKIGAIGFCFGGLCALDLARSGADVKGVVSFHGLFTPPPFPISASIKAKILALHGYDDPMAPPEQILAFAQEMTKAQADWQIHAYGHTQHAFTNPKANNDPPGTAFNERANKRSFQAMETFFSEVFN